MTDEEVKARVAIAHLLGSCALAGDARKAEAYAACFVPEGVLDMGDRGEKLEGREAIRQWMAAPSIFTQEGGASPGFISHHITSSRIEITGADTAQGRTYFLVTSVAGIDHNGYYDDRYRREGNDWLIVYRRPRSLWTSPASVLRTAAT